MRQALAPSAVGVDIGAGMSAVRPSLTAADLPDDLGGLRRAIEKAIPVGFAMHEEPVKPARVPGLDQSGWRFFWDGFDDLTAQVSKLRDRAGRQLGTLGGGNHFVEVCLEQGGPDESRV